MAQAPPAVRHQVAQLAINDLEEPLDWGDFLNALPEGIGDDELIHELIALLQGRPKVGEDFMNVSQEVYEHYMVRVREIIDSLLAQ